MADSAGRLRSKVPAVLHAGSGPTTCRRFTICDARSNVLNLHMRAVGVGESSGSPFRPGINVHVRGTNATE
jgi:hypothetical protein